MRVARVGAPGSRLPGFQVRAGGPGGQIVEANRHDGDKAKPAALVNAYPGLGKSTAVREYGRDYWRAQVALRGETTPDGHRRVPVIYIALTGNTHIRGLNAAICRFYGLPDRVFARDGGEGMPVGAQRQRGSGAASGGKARDQRWASRNGDVPEPHLPVIYREQAPAITGGDGSAARQPLRHRPHPDRAVPASAGQGAPVGAERYREDPAGMPDKRLAERGRLERVGHVPQPDRVVPAASGERVPVAAERQ
jgi:hypothetical protein